MGIEVTGDGSQHFINHRRDGSWFVFGAGCGIGELAHSIQTAFEGEAPEIDIVCEGGLLHDAANDVVGDANESEEVRKGQSLVMTQVNGF